MNSTATDHMNLERLIGRLNRVYGMSIDEDKLEDWPELFVEHGRYMIDPRENRDLGLNGGHWMYYTSRGMMRDRVTALRHVNVFNKHYYRHLTSETFVDTVEDDVISSRTNYLIAETNWEGKSQMLSVGVYYDKVVLVKGEARFLEKVVVPDSFQTSTAIIAPM